VLNARTLVSTFPKPTLDVCWSDQQQRLNNDAEGWSELVRQLAQASVDLVVVEATGGYERGIVLALQSARGAVTRINPPKGGDFAKSMGLLAKTDRRDARGLATLLKCWLATRSATGSSRPWWMRGAMCGSAW
jgi:transposase